MPSGIMFHHYMAKVILKVKDQLMKKNLRRYIIYFLDDGTIYMIIAANKEKFDIEFSAA